MAAPRPRIPLVTSPDNRDESTAKDARLVNCYGEKQQSGEYEVVRRPSLQAITQVVPGQLNGVYNYQGSIYFIVGGFLFGYPNPINPFGSVNLTRHSGPLSLPDPYYYFTSYVGSAPGIFLHNRASAYTFTASGGPLTDVSAAFNSAISLAAGGGAYLDQLTYVAQYGSLYLFNSDLSMGEAPVAWPSSILARIDPESIVFVSKQITYIVVFKQYTIEFFYDAGNATGSPLGPLLTSKLTYGCISEFTVQETEGNIFWIAQTRNNGIMPMVLNNLQAIYIGTPQIDRLLQGAFAVNNANIYSFIFRLDGHLFYVVTFTAANLTLAYDATERLWSQWTDVNGNYWPIAGAAENLLFHENQGIVYQVTNAIYGDQIAVGGPVLPVGIDIYTSNIDLGTRMNKTLMRMDVIADQAVGSTLQVRKNDSDYSPKAWSPFRSFDLGHKTPSIQQCGTFKKRAWHFNHRAVTPFRIKAVELFLQQGTL